VKVPDISFEISTGSVENYEDSYFCKTASVVWWSEILATDPEARVWFPGGGEKGEKKRKTVVGLERGPLRLVSTTEELLDIKVAAPV
jgi:hypothetical protein